jgi:hypothetical protein
MYLNCLVTHFILTGLLLGGTFTIGIVLIVALLRNLKMKNKG